MNPAVISIINPPPAMSNRAVQSEKQIDITVSRSTTAIDSITSIID